MISYAPRTIKLVYANVTFFRRLIVIGNYYLVKINGHFFVK